MTKARARMIVSVVLILGTAHTAAADFNGDGRQDLLWRAHSGNPVIWQMNGPAVDARFTLATAPDAASAIVGSGNFFGGGTSSAILWVDSSDELTIWRVSDGEVQESCVAASGVDPGWTFLGVGDLNGDGVDDVLWRLPDGSVDAYLMNGCNAPQTVTLGATAPASWTFAGVGRVDGHTAATLFWRDSSGDVVLWRLHNGTAIFSTTLAAGAYASWSIAAIADFDGDALSDILWRDAPGTQVALWLMNGTKYSAASVAPASSDVFGEADTIFVGRFDNNAEPAPSPTSGWTILGAADVDGDGRADVVLANGLGDTAIWQMQGASITATGLIPASGDMPYTGLTGWRMALDRPSVTELDGEVTIAWNPLGGLQNYVVYASAANDPASTGVPVATNQASLSFARNAGDYADKRYFALGAEYLGVRLPPSPEAYIVEFALAQLPEWGPLADIDADGCMDILGATGDCQGHLRVVSPAAIGLGAIYANGRAVRDLRFADFNGDGILDAVANTYSCDVPGCGGDDANSQLQLYFGNADGTFTQDPSFSALSLPGGGYGETIVVADFNNDGHLDIFLPKYTAFDPGEHDFLLINDGSGHFTDAADTAGVAMRNVPLCARPEGAQAVDLNGDGWIDLYAGSHLLLNGGADADGVPVFADLGPLVDDLCNVVAPSPTGLPLFFDEGAKFIDLDNSGQLSLALNGANSTPGVGVFRFDGLAHFSQVDAFPPIFLNNAWGFTAADVDGDGLSDLVLAGGCGSSSADGTEIDPGCGTHAKPQLLVNRGGHFVPHDFYDDGLQPSRRGWNDLQTFADFDRSGTVDFISRFIGGDNSGFAVLMNRAFSNDILTVSVADADGEENQAGRIVRVSPVSRPGVVMTQVVDGGSGYMANGPYELSFATPYAGAYTISVRFAKGAYTATAHAGEHLTMRADGTYSVR